MIPRLLAARPTSLIAISAVLALLVSACAGAGVQPSRSTDTSFSVEPAVNAPSTMPAAGEGEPGGPDGFEGQGAVADQGDSFDDDGATTLPPGPSDPDAPTSTVPGDDGSGATTTTSTVAGNGTTTTTASAGPAALPATASVERLTWIGVMNLSAEQEDGSIGTTSGAVTGYHVGPDRHRIEYVEQSTLTSTRGTVLGERTMDWVVGVVNDRAWFEQDGEVEEMSLDQAHRFVPYLSSALEGVVPSDAILADLAGRGGTDVVVLGRAGRRITISNADVELYAPLFLRYTPALYGTSASGTVATVDVVIDLETAAVLEGVLTLNGTTAAGGDFDLTVSYEATAVNDRSIQVLIPG